MIDITEVRTLANRQLELIFGDGTACHSRIFDMDIVLQGYTGVFALLVEDFSRQVKVDRELGTMVWLNGADVCPDLLYSFASE